MEYLKARRTRDYQYDKHELDPGGAVHLLELASGSQRDELVGQFKTANIDNPADEFESLSYTWGSGKRSHHLWIRYIEDGTPRVAKIGITKNLWRALKALRLENRTRTLWADAVCINQEDNEERERQVVMMGRIYGASTRTVVYLGEKIPNNELTAENLQMAVLFTSMTAFMGYSTIDLSEDGAGSVLAKILVIIWLRTWCCPSPRALCGAVTQIKQALKWYKESKAGLNAVRRWWRGWIALFSRPWFRRVWVVQEFVRAQKLSFQAGRQVICGDGADLSMDGFKDILRQVSMMGPGFGVRDREKYVPHLSGSRNLMRLYELRSAYETGARRPTLLSVLGFFRNSDATDPRDKLYALLGLSREAHEPGLAPRYGEDVRETLLRYASFLVAQPNGVQVLYDLRCGHSCDGLPSWVPLWTENLDSRNLWIPWMTYLEPLHDGREAANIVAKAPYRASGPSAPSLHISAGDSATLLTQGVIIGTTAHVGRVFLTSKARASKTDYGVTSMLLAFYDEMDTMVSNNNDRIFVPPGETLREAKWRTLRSDCTEYTREDLQSLLEEHDRRIFALRTRNVAEVTRSMRNLISQCARMAPWQIGRLHAYDSKKLALTEEGYMCLVPHSTGVGDRVCVIRGSAVPHVLRPASLTSGSRGMAYKLLGTAYVHGAMQGEVLRREELRERELALV